MMTFQIKFIFKQKIQLMEEQHELYEYAEKIEAKKGLYLHFVLLFLASLLFVSTKLFNFS
jgi:hypothetical protein